jgi:hypothetical protein
MSSETKVDAAQRMPRGQEYIRGNKKGGVEYVPSSEEDEVEEEQVYSKLTPDGRQEIPDPVPTALPIGYSTGPSLADFVQRMISNERVKALLDDEGFDTPEEADDFDIEDDPLDPLTPYEQHFYPSQSTRGSGNEGGAGGAEGSPKSASAPPAPETSNEKSSNQKDSPPPPLDRGAGG